MKSPKRTVAALAAGVAAAAVAWATPDDLVLPALVGGAAFVFVLYALRERAALRALIGPVRQLVQRDNQQAKVLKALREQLTEHANATVGHGGVLDRIAGSVDRAGHAWHELAALNAAATAEILDRAAASSAEILDRVAATSAEIHDRVAATTETLDRVAATTGEVHGRVEATADMLDRITLTGEAVEQGIGRIDGGLSQVEQLVTEARNDLLADVRRARNDLQADVRRARNDILVGAGRDYAQVEATVNLHSVLGVRGVLPPSRHWAASPDLLLLLVSCVLDRRPGLIVELGGGLSTVWLAYAVEKAGGGRIVSLDHDETFAARTRDALASHGLDAVAEVRVAALKDLEIGDEVYPWYDLHQLTDIKGCELLVVDGPPGSIRARGRFPALPLLAGDLAEHAVVIVDDCVRDDEQAIIAAWQEAFPEFSLQMFDHEKGTAVLTR